ncbi:MAG: HDOD domain-containing protein [Candidatus Nitrohelix vancouverensis]|uniref:HDOD domain-containing protein n=1 Tax=Candidatus Nitrohelix vancouverensis TaxID=2705534 RepID=A0A7T0G4J1_9BACT|nr:MAG: HDOD domain-containing protein [Candidatus Nitrohelix vancouverensis]
MQNKDIDAITEDWVATPPAVYFKFKEAVEDPDTSFKEFSEILSADPGLLIRLLKIVNSPFYGLDAKVETVEHAMTIVGLNQLSDLVLTTTIMNEFSGVPGDLLNMNTFWEHSVAVGVSAQILAGYLGEKELERFYIAGMLHDIGTLVICKKAPEKMMRAVKLEKEGAGAMHETEREVMGFSHADVGSSLLRAWKLPQRLLDCVSFHHHPLDAKRNMKEAAIIYFADYLADQIGSGDLGDVSPPKLDPAVLKSLELNETILLSMREESQERFAEAIKLFS